MDNFCRWCRWFKGGCCVNGDAFDYEIDLSGFYEEGILSEAIKEGFKDVEFKRVRKLLASKVSKKLQEDVRKLLIEEFDDLRTSLIEDIDGSVSSALNNFVKKGFIEGVYIRNPEEFGCKLFW